MSEDMTGLRRKIASASDLKTVVRSMKALAAASIGQYERAVAALVHYEHTVNLGLGVALRTIRLQGSPQPDATTAPAPSGRLLRAVVFGSDQGLVGPFNERVAQHTKAILTDLQGTLLGQEAQVWAVGERVHESLEDVGLHPQGQFNMPASVNDIGLLVGQILSQTSSADPDQAELHLFYNKTDPQALWGSVNQRLLPLDDTWRQSIEQRQWPAMPLPELIGDTTAGLGALVREHLFVSVFRACAESLASENLSRLAAMERADRNIEELLHILNASFHHKRQASIDAEMFDVIAGFDALSVRKIHQTAFNLWACTEATMPPKPSQCP